MAEHLVDSLADVPSFMKTALVELGNDERKTKKMCMELSSAQKKLLESMLAMTKSEKPVDYEAIVSAKEVIGKRRAEVNTNMESQSRKAQKVYDKMDATISNLDEKIGVLNGLLDAVVGARESANRKDATVGTTEDEEALVDASRARFQLSVEEYDPNEPVYCVCRKVSSGKMVGCTNDDCLVEWFHYECVGIPQDVADAELDEWLCPQCRPPE